MVTQGTTATLYDNGVPSSSLYLTWYPITLASNSNKWVGPGALAAASAHAVVAISSGYSGVRRVVWLRRRSRYQPKDCANHHRCMSIRFSSASVNPTVPWYTDEHCT